MEGGPLDRGLARMIEREDGKVAGGARVGNAEEELVGLDQVALGRGDLGETEVEEGLLRLGALAANMTELGRPHHLKARLHWGKEGGGRRS